MSNMVYGLFVIYILSWVLFIYNFDIFLILIFIDKFIVENKELWGKLLFKNV